MTRILDVAAQRSMLKQIGTSEFLTQLIARLRSTVGSQELELTTSLERAGFHYIKPELGLVEWMPTMEIGRRVSIKTVSYHPTNPFQRGLPSVLATTSLYDTSDGRLLALVESTILTALRTGAASAVAADVLAHPEASTVGVVGCGAQAVTQLHGLTLVRPIKRVIAFDTVQANAESLAARTGFLGLDVEVVSGDRLDYLVDTCDVLVTATSVDPGAGPVLPDTGNQEPWLHVNAVGADFGGKIELPRSMLLRSLVCPDVVGQCLIEGESQQLDPDQLGPDLEQLVKRGSDFQAFQQQMTVFDSTGWALEDMIAAELALDLATELGIGLEIDLQSDSGDPHNPYDLL